MRTLIIGFDSFDPRIFEELADAGKLPNLSRIADTGGYSRFEVSTPPQTEVSWTSIATGLDPGGHGIFDFVHRNPASYSPFVSLLPTKSGVLGTQFVPPYKAHTIFTQAVDLGYPATSLWWPATFPARPESPVRSIPGLGTPDIRGQLGVGMLFASDGDGLGDAERKTQVIPLQRSGRGRYRSAIPGPLIKKRADSTQTTLPLQLEISADRSARLAVGKQSLDLRVGEWSPVIELEFKAGLFVKIHAVTQMILTQVQPEVRLYSLPLQIHPLSSTWRYATPKSLVKSAWEAGGPFLSLGWPQDTTGLEEGCMTDEQFLALCESIDNARERVLLDQLAGFREGVLAAIFDSLDRIQHMFRRDRPEIVAQWYIRLDALAGRVENELEKSGGKPAKFLVMSDHGFADFGYKVHLNRWLVEKGYLATKDGGGKGLSDVDWSKSAAYAIGLNSLYLNLAGREGGGIVALERVESLVAELKAELTAWGGPDGRQVISRALSKEQAFSGSLTPYGPDIVLGYSSGYRASAETGLGKWGASSIEPNHDHWGADHCIDSQLVPGVLFSKQGLSEVPSPSYRDIPMLVLDREIEHGDVEPPTISGDEDEDVLEERLKGLGYL